MDSHLMFPFAFINVLAMAALAIINVRAANARTSNSLARESRRLRLALHTELYQLSLLLTDNLERIENNGEFLLSTRSGSSIYRTNLGRLHLLPEHDIPAIVSAYAWIDRIEAFVAARCKAQGTLSYLAPKDNPEASRDIISQYQRSRAELENALTIMNLDPMPPRIGPAEHTIAIRSGDLQGAACRTSL